MSNRSKPPLSSQAPVFKAVGPRARAHGAGVAREMIGMVRKLGRRLEKLSLERDLQNLVLHISRILLTTTDQERMFKDVSSALHERIQHDYMSLTILEADGSKEWLLLLDTPFSHGGYKIGGTVPAMVGPARKALETHAIDVIGPDRIAALQPPEMARLHKKEGIRSVCFVPMFSRGKALGVMALGSRREDLFQGRILSLLDQVAGQFALALDNAIAFQDLQTSRDRLEKEKLYLQEEVRQDFATGELVGTSPAFSRILEQIDTVAPSDATVLLLGETGTGKELLARAIHERSKRKENTFVKLNCSAIPMGLVESELFGHERGAFTGAIAKKVGRFELAHLGSLFLDEIGDMPLELQPKLLRAVQEREFERLGSTRTLSVDVRLVAATHQNLAEMVEKGLFRRDLFYRLNVFPIKVPPLRERKEDIPNLVRYFTQKFARAMDRRIERIPVETMQFLVQWPWPGNIRELQNLVERSVILSPGPELRVPLGEMVLPSGTTPEPLPAASLAPMTLENLERQGILDALKASGGVVGGPEGAAARLGLPRTTLHSKMKRLGLDRTR